jgi:hypothetical protein
MVIKRQCAFRFPNGELCRMAPLKEGQCCWAHSPEHAQEAQEARKLGGLRKRREATVSLAYDFEGLDTVAAIRRLLEIAATDTLGLDNSVSRNRMLVSVVQAALQALEKGELEQRIELLEQSVHPKQISQAPPVFDVETQSPSDDDKEDQK